MPNEDDIRSLEELEPPVITPHKNAFYAGLMDDMGNGIRYFGKVIKHNSGTTAAFICPVCNEEFRERVSVIKSGAIHSCGCDK